MTPLSDPIPGGTGSGGSVWTRFAPGLQKAGLASDLVITLRAMGGTSIADWSMHGKCFEALVGDLPTIQNCRTPVTHVVFHQGERDTYLGTDAQTYVRHFEDLYQIVSDALPQVPWIVCKASYRMGVTSTAVRQAQEKIISRFSRCRLGPDTDRLGADFRFDNTHFNDSGLQTFANELLTVFASEIQSDAESIML